MEDNHADHDPPEPESSSFPPISGGASPAFASLTDALASGLVERSSLPGDSRPTIVAVGLPPSAFRTVIHFSAATARKRFEDEVMPDSGRLPPVDHTFCGLLSEAAADELLADFETEMNATSVGATVSSEVDYTAAPSQLEDGPSASPDLDGPGVAFSPDAVDAETAVVHTRSSSSEGLNQPIPSDGWQVPNIRTLAPEDDARLASLVADRESRFPARTGDTPPVLFVNDLMFSLFPGDRETPTDSGVSDDWWVTAITNDHEEVSWFRRRFLRRWDDATPVVSFAPDRDILLAAATNAASQQFTDLLDEGLRAPLSNRSRRTQGKPRGGRVPAPALTIAEGLVAIAAIDRETTRAQLVTLSRNTNLLSSSTIDRAEKRLIDAGLIETAPDPNNDSPGRPSEVYRLNPDGFATHPLPDEPASDPAEAVRAVGYAFAEVAD
jgi:hypothetical protein